MPPGCARRQPFALPEAFERTVAKLNATVPETVYGPIASDALGPVTILKELL